MRCVALRFNDFVAPLLKRKHIKEDRVSPSSNSEQSKDYASPPPLLAQGGLASFQQMPQSGFGIFCYQGVLCVPQGSETLRSGYGTPRIPVKDAGGITHAAIICSYLKLEMFRGYLRDSGSSAQTRAGDFGVRRVLRALKETRHRPGGRERKKNREGLYICQPGLYQPFYGQIFFLLSRLDKESP